MPRLGRRTTQVLSTLASVLLLVAVWWVQAQGNEDTGDRARDRASSSTAPTPTPDGGGVDADGIPYVDLADLPPEATATVRLIDAGGPFPYPGKDGSTFGNFEGILPDRQRGYYAEYTVETPGLDHRGARRIIAGDGGELYWTGDHYLSFERIRR